jgi:1,2-phenylacetyl-CoA epoxidase PaaB subunit
MIALSCELATTRGEPMAIRVFFLSHKGSAFPSERESWDKLLPMKLFIKGYLLGKKKNSQQLMKLLVKLGQTGPYM